MTIELRPSTITKHAILLPHITLGTQSTFTVSDEFAKLLQPEGFFLFKVENNKVFIKKTCEIDSFSLLKYNQKHNHVFTSTPLADFFRGMFSCKKIIFMLPMKANQNLKQWTELNVKIGNERNSKA